MNKPRRSRAKAPAKKPQLHPRNPHQPPYDFAALRQAEPALEHLVRLNPRGEQTIDFSDPIAVKALNSGLLKACYGLDHWDIPQQYLCPPVPGRADYIHHLADLLAQDNQGTIPKGKRVKLLDIGSGANCIYPILGHRSYGWKMVGSDIDPVSVANARNIVSANKVLKGAIDIRQQQQSEHFFDGILKPDEMVDATLCNPPFHRSAEEARRGSQRKVTNLSTDKQAADAGKAPQLNFGGQDNELWCPGGEALFIANMIDESIAWRENCLWFTSLVSQQENLKPLLLKLKQSPAAQIEVIEMAQGQKRSRFVAWSFFNQAERQAWCQLRWR